MTPERLEQFKLIVNETGQKAVRKVVHENMTAPGFAATNLPEVFYKEVL